MRLRKSQVGTESMLRRTIAVAVVTLTLFFLSLGSSQAQTPNTDARAEQSDKILFERAMKAINKSQYGAARSLLETSSTITRIQLLCLLRSSPLATRGTRKAVTSKRSWKTGTSLLFPRTGQRRLQREGKSTLSKERQNSKVGFRCSGRRGRPNITFLHSFDLGSPLR